ncbi:MAG: hypothetical protein J0L75_14360 [Spirochaetes bacterium]|nr:hypothetical protein [Spirochaetota bacterium]
MANRSTPFFMTHHAPPGAWSSLTFGVPGQGVSLNQEVNEVDISADLLVAVSRGPGRVRALPFVTGASALDPETLQREAAAGTLDARPNAPRSRWSFAPEDEITRALGPCSDQYTWEDLSLTVRQRPCEFPDFEKTGVQKGAAGHSLLPAVWLELSIDNRASKDPAMGFIGLSIFKNRLRTLDLTHPGKLCGVAYSDRWALAAVPVPGAVGTMRDGAIARHIEQMRPAMEHKGREGGVWCRVPPGARRTLTCVLAFYRGGVATQGVKGVYAYSAHWPEVEAVALAALSATRAVKAEAEAHDRMIAAAGGTGEQKAVFAQAVRAYAANTQMTLAGKKVLYTVLEGMYCWRNTMDLCADHLPFELWRSPWLVRNLLDQFLDRYTTRDRLRFPGQKAARPGGLSFTHDMGSYTTYTPPGTSGYEQPGITGCYSYMTQEELLNGAFLLGAYALTGGDKTWWAKRGKALVSVLDSMENRDHPVAAQRDGIMKGESLLVGESGAEITSYDALDHSLMAARGNGYLAVKTFAAALVLQAAFARHGKKTEAARAGAYAARCAATLEKAFDESKAILPANLYSQSESRVAAAVEGLAVPLFLGLKKAITAHPGLVEKLKRHLHTCLVPGQCIDAATGGLRLSSTSPNTWPSKGILVLYVMENLFSMDLKGRYGSLLPELVAWCQVSAKDVTVSDQILSDTRKTKGAHYYPRIVTAALWLKPTLKN